VKRDSLTYIKHIIECIQIIEKYVEGKNFNDFLNSVQLQDSVIRRIEIIGEAIKNLDDELKENYPDISWKRFSGMRDILIHKYFGVDLMLTWNVVQVEIPKLKKEMFKIQEYLEK